MHAKATLDGLEVSSSRLFFRVYTSADVAPQGACGQALMWKKIRHRHLRLRSFDSPSNLKFGMRTAQYASRDQGIASRASRRRPARPGSRCFGSMACAEVLHALLAGGCAAASHSMMPTAAEVLKAAAVSTPCGFVFGSSSGA